MLLADVITDLMSGLSLDFLTQYSLNKMDLSYWLSADGDDLLKEDTFFNSSDYSCLLDDKDWD